MARLKYVLPEEMVIEILCRLPVKTLLRFRCVCKSWLSIISEPQFIMTHMYHRQIMASKIASPLMITYDHGPLRFASGESHYHLHTPLEVIGSCNGIICLLVDHVRCLLWNPSTMQAKKTTQLPKKQRAMGYRFQVRRLVFGFDSVSDDYKVTRLMGNGLQLYSSNTDAWKEIHARDASVSRVFCSVHFIGPVIDGVLYMGNEEQLVLLDLRYEVFTLVPYPSSMFLGSVALDFNGSVAVILSDKKCLTSLSLWTLENISGEVSWTKKFIVHDDAPRIYSYLGGGHFYGRNGIGNQFNILYDYKKKESHTLRGPGRKLTPILKYTETFASIEGFKPSVCCQGMQENCDILCC